MRKPLKSPTARLLAGLAVTLAAVAVFSWYALQQISRLRDLQTQTVDRNRKDSLQLLRIQNDLHTLGFAMRDMINGDEPYPLEAWKGQFDRTRADLADALRTESQLAPAERSPARQAYFRSSLAQLWISAGQVFALARGGDQEHARDLVRTSLESQQAAIAANVARLLFENNESEEQAVTRIQAIYRGVERNVYLFLAAMLLAISLTSLYLIYFNRRLFDSLALLSAQRSDLARKLITMQEEVLRSISRELHDEFGQILTAMGAMLTRAEKQDLPPAFRSDLAEIRDVATSALDKTRSLSLALHPSILDEGGLEQAIDWYVPMFERQTGILVRYEKSGTSPVISDGVAIHVYRVLQEALNNVARHSKSERAWVRVQFSTTSLRLEVEDRGVGISIDAPKNGLSTGRRGIGMVAMRERAELLHAELEFAKPATGGAVVRLNVPLAEEVAHGQ
jgi:signal transduction histidine kinase